MSDDIVARLRSLSWAEPAWTDQEVTEEAADTIERLTLTPDDERAIRIGRAVLASEPRPTTAYRDMKAIDYWNEGHNSARLEYLEAGDPS